VWRLEAGVLAIAPPKASGAKVQERKRPDSQLALSSFFKASLAPKGLLTSSGPQREPSRLVGGALSSHQPPRQYGVSYIMRSARWGSGCWAKRKALPVIAPIGLISAQNNKWGSWPCDGPHETRGEH
jgi:hypothetical protein